MLSKNNYLIIILSIFFTLLIQSTSAAGDHSWAWDEATGTLTINIISTANTNNATIISVCSQGYVVINNNTWPRKPDSSLIRPEELKKIIINDGDGNDDIDLTLLSQTSFPQLVTGSEPNVVVNLSGGADYVRASPLDDLIKFFTGGAAQEGSSQIIYGNAGNDQITGGPGNDELYGDEGDDLIIGGGGDDILRGGTGNDEIQGTEGTNDIFGGDGNDVLQGGTNDDFLYGENGDDIIHGGTGNDLLDGGPGADELRGDDGNDELLGDTGDDILYGGSGNDIIRGNDDNDFLYGESGDDILQGGSGNDRLFGSTENDILEGGPGSDILQGDCNDDQLFDIDDAQMIGGTGNDLYIPLVVRNPSALNKGFLLSTIEIDDEGGNDTLTFANHTLAVDIDLSLLNTEQTFDADGNIINLKTIIENFIGSGYDDVINLSPDLSTELNVNGGPHTNGDVLNVDAQNNDCTNDGSCVITNGYANVNYSNIETVNLLNVTDVGRTDELPAQFALLQNYPNPFNPSTIISYDIPESCLVELCIYDLLGRKLITLVKKEQPAGNYQIEFHAGGLTSGIYIYKITAGNFVKSDKMMLLK